MSKASETNRAAWLDRKRRGVEAKPVAKPRRKPLPEVKPSLEVTAAVVKRKRTVKKKAAVKKRAAVKKKAIQREPVDSDDLDIVIHQDRGPQRSPGGESVACPFGHSGQRLYFSTWRERAQHLREAHGWL